MSNLIITNKKRFALNFFLTLVYGYVMLLLGSSSDATVGIFIYLIATFILTYLVGMAWRYKLNFSLSASEDGTVSVDHTVKRKRKAIDDVLQDLSDDDLLELRRRLQERTIDEDELYGQFVGDDGELVYRN